jgi:8-oxo-dGTP pyrophosphatase MutT (NUDIX family)
VNAVLVPRPASTLMVVRDGEASLEVLMLRRSLESEFVRGAYVFPGGAVDPGDDDPEMLGRCTGRTDAEASAVLELDSGGLAYWVSAFRECFEEAGVLVAAWPGGRPLTFDDPEVERRFVGHRHALNAGERSFLDICRTENLTLPAQSVHYVGHWITPEGPPRRYDTRFFVTLAPAGQTAVHDEVETIDHMWVGPQDALDRHEEGRIELVFPTVWNLRLLARYTTADDLVASVSTLAPVPTIQPTVVFDEEGRARIIAPAESGDRGAGAGDPEHRRWP